METIREINQRMIESEIKLSIASGKYKNIDELKTFNPSLNNFCLNHKLNYIMHSFSTHSFSTHSFSTQFKNEDYLNLLNKLEKELSFENKNGKLVETNINGKVFLERRDTQKRETLVGIDEINPNNYINDTFEKEKSHEKRAAKFLKINEINISQLNKEQMQIYNAIIAEPDPSKYEIYFDENNNMTNTVRDNENYYTIENNGGEIIFNKEESSEKGNKNSISKSKQLTLSNGHNISDGFVNTLILAFVIGSFFGVIFLAIYTKVMH